LGGALFMKGPVSGRFLPLRFLSRTLRKLVGAAQTEKPPTNGHSIFVLLSGVWGALGCGKDKKHAKKFFNIRGGVMVVLWKLIFLIAPERKREMEGNAG
jgi:hypothetical protein